RCDRHEPPGRISEGPPEAVPSEGHTTSVATPAHGYLGNPGPPGQPETDATSAVELPQIPQTGPADARPAVGRSDPPDQRQVPHRTPVGRGGHRCIGLQRPGDVPL